MKTIAVSFLAALLAPVTVVGQGQFMFDNHMLPDIDARFRLSCDPPGYSSIGNDYKLTLFVSPVPALDPPSTTFLGEAGSLGAGYVVPTLETVPGVLPGETATIGIRVSGPTFTTEFGPFHIQLGGGTLPVPILPLEDNLLVNCVPEPSIAVFALLGLGILCLRGVVDHRQRKSRRSVAQLGCQN
jgi:hypothetical protein